MLSSVAYANHPSHSIIEAAVVILVSCTPSIHLFWTTKGKTLRSRLGLSTNHTTDAKSKKGISDYSSGSTSDNIRVTTRHYVELQDYAGNKPEQPTYEARAHGTHSDV